MLIVGAGPGISLSTAKKFGRGGFKMSLITRRLNALQQYEEELSSLGIEVKGFHGDISSKDSLKNSIDSVVKTYGKIDVLLYIAAAEKPSKPTDLNAGDLIRDFNNSVTGALTSVKEVLPYIQI